MRFKAYYGDGTISQEIEAANPNEAREIAKMNPLQQMKAAKGRPQAMMVLKVKRVRMLHAD